MHTMLKERMSNTDLKLLKSDISVTIAHCN